MMSILVLILTFFATTAHAESVSELTCKAQAKEIAVQTYSSCITVARNSEIDQIRKNYKEDLASLKSKYDKELKKMGSSKNTGTKPAKKVSKRPSAPTVSEVREVLEAPRPTKGIARQLPTRKATRELPFGSVTESANMESIIIDRESEEAESMDIIPMPEIDESPAT